MSFSTMEIDPGTSQFGARDDALDGGWGRSQGRKDKRKIKG